MKKSPTSRTENNLTNLIQLTSSVSFFNENICDIIIHKNCCKKMKYKFKSKDEIVFKENSLGDLFYIILQGEVRIESKIYDYQNKCEVKKDIGELHSGNSFGELSLLENKPRIASIICKSDCHFAILDKESYNKILYDYQKYQLNTKVEFLNKLEPFKHLVKSVMQNLSYFFKCENYSRNHFVYKQNDESNNIFIVYSGEFKVIFNFY